MLAFAIVFALISAYKTDASRRQLSYAMWIPSGVAFATSFLTVPSFTIARLIGGVVGYIFRARFAADGGRDIRLIVIAAGFVLGEGAMSIVTLVLRNFGVGA